MIITIMIMITFTESTNHTIEHIQCPNGSYEKINNYSYLLCNESVLNPKFKYKIEKWLTLKEFHQLLKS